MKTIIAIFVLAGVLLLLMYPVPSKGDTIYITPTTSPVWTQTYDPPSQPDAAQIAGWVGYSGTLLWLYKAEVGPPYKEEGSYAGSYQTTFGNTPTDPEDATISYVGGPYISVSPLYLLIKDGKATPTLYIFNLGNINTSGYTSPDSWDCTEDIVMTDFWTTQGAISNLAILGPMTVPEPGILILIGIAMTAVGVASRYVRKG